MTHTPQNHIGSVSNTGSFERNKKGSQSREEQASSESSAHYLQVAGQTILIRTSSALGETDQIISRAQEILDQTEKSYPNVSPAQFTALCLLSLCEQSIDKQKQLEKLVERMDHKIESLIKNLDT